MVEHIGETTGLPFGHYSYTEVLQPQLLGVVPLAIPCAWLMVALGAWQLTHALFQKVGRPLLVATLVVAIDLQIEPVATQIHSYWIWHDLGFYYGVPLLNFAGWWLVGLLVALLLRSALERGEIGDWRLEIGKTIAHRPSSIAHRRWSSRLFEWVPALLYLLSAVMFTVVNLAHGLILAGLCGVALLGGIVLAAFSALDRRASLLAVPAADRSDRSGLSGH
jgi:putative membrane protein